MAATVAVNTVGRIATMATLSAIKVTIDANSVSYTTTQGGLAIDLFTALNNAGPFNAAPNGNDIIGCLPLGRSSGGFIPWSLAVGTITSTTIPCTLKLIGGATAATGLTEIADGACTQTFAMLVLVARGGTN